MAPNQLVPPPAEHAPPATQPPPAAPTQRRPAQSSRRNYSKPELLHFFEIMHEHMPIGGDKWDLVLEHHSLSYPGREVESLRCKFAQLHRVKTPTGDPRCPQEVKLAKRMKYIISSRAEMLETARKKWT
jgi:hypothetical protein